jgi:hypothetical protein
MVKKKKKNLIKRFLTENIGMVPRKVGMIGGGFMLKFFDGAERLAYNHKFPVVAIQTADQLVPLWDMGHF